jgi:hypothetical protein
MNRGGKRKGAGRKPAPEGARKLAYNTKLAPDLIDYLRSLNNAAEAIDLAIRESKQFKERKND